MKPETKQRIEQIKAGQVPAGYKKTKVGIVPTGWVESKLSHYLTVNNDKNEDLEYGKEDVFSISGELGVVNQIELLGRSYAGASVAPYGIVYPNNIVYTKSPLKANPYGIIKTNKTGKTGIVSTLYAIFHCKDNVHPDYVQLYFESDKNLNNYLYPIVNIGAKHDMKISDENSLKGNVIFPSLEEQEKIADILSAQDKVIELKEKLLVEKRKQKKYLMQQLLTGKKRLPGFSGEWENHKLGEFIIEHTEKTTKNNQYPVLTSSRQGLFLQSDYYNKEVASEDNTGYNVVPRGFFTYRHMSDDEIFKFNINNIVDRGIVSTLYPVFTTKNICNHYLQSLLNEGNEFKKFALLQKQGGSRTYMYLDKLKQLYVSVPCVEEQEAISRILLTCDNEIELLQKSFEQEKQKKKALMQLLLMGIVRV